LLKALADGPFPNRYAIHSFDHRITARLAKARPGLALGALMSSRVLDPLAVLQAAHATTLWQEWTMLDPALVEAVHEAGGRVIAWTVNDRAASVRLAGMGVDGLCGNFPDRLRIPA
jgi:glycerophosphoryl diester phosphodiesterase